MLKEKIKILREITGLNQNDFGKKFDVTKQCISNWENGNIQPSIDMLIKIATTFSISTDYLLGLSNNITIDATGLTTEQILHIQALINDIKGNVK